MSSHGPTTEIVLSSSRRDLPQVRYAGVFVGLEKLRWPLLLPRQSEHLVEEGPLVKQSHLHINYESVTFPSLISPTAGWSGPSTRPWGGQILLTVGKARGLELLLSSTPACVAISAAGKFSQCDEGCALDQGPDPFGLP